MFKLTPFLILLFFISSHSIAEISHNLYGFPLGYPTTLKEFSYKGNIKTVTKAGYSISVRHGRKFHRAIPAQHYKFGVSGNLEFSSLKSETVSTNQFFYKNNRIDKVIKTIKHTLFDDNSNNESTAFFHYKQSKLYGIIAKSRNGKGCTKYTYNNSKITNQICNYKAKTIYDLGKDGKINSITTIPIMGNPFKDQYTYNTSKVVIENIVQDTVKRKTVLTSDKFDNFISRETSLLVTENNPFGKNIESTRSTYNIEKYDRFGNPVKATLSIYETEKGKTEILIKESFEEIEYSYFD